MNRLPASPPTGAAPPSQRLGLRHVEVVRALILTGSATGAAARLHVTQPAVSKLLRDAEERLGFTLFDRRAGRLVPTAAAQRLFDEIERSFTGLDEINAVCRRLRTSAQRQLTVAASPALAAAVLPGVIETYRRMVEPAFFSVHSRSTEHVAALVSSGKADIGFSLDGPAVPGLHSERLGALPLLCYLPPGHPLSALDVVHAAALRGEPMITLSDMEGIDGTVAEAFRACGGPPASVAECPAAIAAGALVEAGVGFTLLDPMVARVLRHANVAVRRFAPASKLVFRACWLRSRKPHFARDRIVEMVRATLADLAEPWAGPMPARAP